MLLRRVLAVHTALGLALAHCFTTGNVEAREKAARAAEVVRGSDDEAFLAARDAATQGNRERLAQLAPRLRDYPLSEYVDYWRLQLRMRNEEPARLAVEVAAFMAKNSGTYIADRMLLEWLVLLGTKHEFEAFARELPQLVWSDDPQLRCLIALARYQRNEGRRIEELAREARQLLLATREAGGDGCWTLTEALLVDERESPWDRMRALVEANQVPTAKRVVAWLPKADSAQISIAIDRPATWLANNERRLAAQRDLALVAIARLAREEPARAARFAGLLDPDLTPQQRGLVWGRIGHMAAYKQMPEAIEWYRKGGDQVGVAPETARAEEVLEWQVRAALRGTDDGPDWPMVRDTIQRMPPEERAESAWVYWYARALLTESHASEASVYLRSLARGFDFYGKLAAEELGIPIAIPPRAAAPTQEQIEAWNGNPGFARALKFYDLGLRAEGNKEWAWQLRGKNDRELLAAAEYARQINVFDRMIAASERTRDEFDFSQRFPAPHRAELTRHAQAAGLDETWIYALIRQESRFVQDARSAVGAQGLMQIMPATARYVARRIGMSDYNPTRIVELDTNLFLGTNYLKLVFEDLDGQLVVASAAYNAGPNRARAWRASLPRTLEGAIFAETIPFNETREYVKKVMANAVTYAAIFEQPNVSLKALLGSVSPKAAGTSDLP
ncbi:MAG TPA: transglycosylase SLT domain-containing protein [Burkholderiaceae bacterium]|nr:transglycosylase SLT domain-containing protein [Burkholderiaceae bacterium]